MKRKLMQLRIDKELKDWIELQAQKNNSSQNSEIIRCIREKMEKKNDYVKAQ